MAVILMNVTGVTIRPTFENASGAEYESANGAEYDSQGQARSEAERVAPGYAKTTRSRPEGPKYTEAITPFQGWNVCLVFLPGATRFALAPGFHIPRRWRCHIPRRWRSGPIFCAEPSKLVIGS
ncbi:MAG TPA: hypothetical protein VLB46_17210 [Pyrinomonadaceae bacterium]|nr:hypothetical protein [Pyrinomonadaceae bacterium]